MKACLEHYREEEADGVTEAEWEAFKALRQALPEGAAAQPVRTMRRVRTGDHAGFEVRRSPASLKGVFAGREVRVRVDLGVPLAVRPA